MNKVLSVDYNTSQGRKLHIPLAVFKKPVNEDEYDERAQILDVLMDEVRDQEEHPLALAMQIIGDNLESYDDEVNKKIGHGITPIEIVTYLMKEHDLTQNDLKDIFGSQGNVSSFLNGRRELNLSQIRALKRRFGIDPSLFI